VKLYDLRTLILNASAILSPPVLHEMRGKTGGDCVNLLRQLALSETQRSSGKIVQNFLIASLTLSWLHTAAGASAANVLWGDGLRLPAKPSELLNHSVHSLSFFILFLFTEHKMATECRVSADELASIEAVFHQSKMTGTQTPLQATIMISPLMLLLPINLLALRWSKKKLLDVSVCIPRQSRLNHFIYAGFNTNGQRQTQIYCQN